MRARGWVYRCDRDYACELVPWVYAVVCPWCGHTEASHTADWSWAMDEARRRVGVHRACK